MASGLALAAVGAATSSSILLAPFAASAALKHAAPHKPDARPLNVIGGYLIGATVGVGAGFALGQGVAAVLVASTVTAVLLVAADLEHPPAVAMALVALTEPGLWPLQAALAGSVTLTATMALLAPSLHGRERVVPGVLTAFATRRRPGPAAADLAPRPPPDRAVG